MADVAVSTISPLVFNLLNGAIIFILVLLAIGVLVGIGYYVRSVRRFNQYRVVIWKTDNEGRVSETYDKAGIFIDNRTKNKRLFFKNSGVGLNPDNVPSVPGPKGVRVIYARQVGLKNFILLNPKLGQYRLQFEVGEEDVNWGINAYERNKVSFMKTKLMQLLPYIMFALVVVAVVIILVFLFSKFDSLQALGVSLERASQVIADAQSNTTILR